jgi:alginate O-acetyltransferase complex protein AlgI
MLFNSYGFILAFLPVCLLAYHGFRAAGLHEAAISSVLLLSFVFYGYAEPQHLLVLLGSIVVNYGIGRELLKQPRDSASGLWLLVGGIGFNLGLLGVFKYLGFFATNVEALTGAQLNLPALVLPIGISFYTFQQIGYLVDCRRGKAQDRGPLRYAFFVSFFPQLIAGPIVHHAELLPQLDRNRRQRLALDLAVGLTIFTAGLFKKVVLADGMAWPAGAMFDTVAATGQAPDLITAWGGALAYSLQIYFDFSGYSDMAVGLGRMFGIRLPVNFASPYKARSIIEFWRRWHITLSRFLRDYLYLPLGGSRRGKHRRYANLLLTMLLGGLWHGAAWTFVLWGAAHGVMLALNHLWRDLAAPRLGVRMPVGLGRALTFLGVVLAWVPFRSADLSTMLLVYEGMLMPSRIMVPESLAALAGLVPALTVGDLALPSEQAKWIPLLLAFVWLTPNIYEVMRAATPALGSPGYPATFVAEWARWPRWRPSNAWSIAAALLFTTCLLKLNDISAFIYFQF